MEKTIIIRLMGGLGNQLFQFSFGLNLTSESMKKLVLDASSYSKDLKRISQLSQYEYADREICIEQRRILGTLYKIIEKLKINSRLIRMERKQYSFLGLDLDGLYYAGNWQNMNYLFDMSEFRKKFIYKGKYTDKQNELNELISNTNSVAIHIRRTDYLLPENKDYNVLSETYYRNAIAFINARINAPFFFVFSDDIGCAKKMLEKYDNVIFIDNSYNNTDVQEFEMMRRCKHFIIANSTFSWWASQLAENCSKIMISPKTWFLCETNEACLEALMKDYYLIDD